VKRGIFLEIGKKICHIMVVPKYSGKRGCFVRMIEVSVTGFQEIVIRLE